MIDMLNGALRIVISLENLIVFGWMAYWAVKFFRSYRRGENGITLAMSVLFFALAIDRVWSVTAAIYTIFNVTALFSFMSLFSRLIIICFIIAGMVFITWRFQNDKDNRQQDSAEG